MNHPPTRDELAVAGAAELRAAIARLDQDLQSLHLDDRGEPRDLTAEEQARFAELMQLQADGEAFLRVRSAIGNPKAVVSGFPTFNTNTRQQISAADALKADGESVRSSATALAGSEDRLTPEQQAQFESLVRQDTDSCDGSYIARRALITESPAYRSAWAQCVTQVHPILTIEESAALRSLRDLDRSENRAMSEGTTTAGGFGVPTFIDPTILMSSQGSADPFLQIARVVPTTTSVWKGVSSAGVSWSFDAEAATVSDDSPTLAQPTVGVYMARGFVPFSIEVGMDYPNFATEMAALLTAGYEELLAEKFATGSGSGEPRGVLTALAATASSQVTPTTDGAFGQEDVYKTWKALPERFRSRASWVMSVDVNNRVRQMGTYTQLHAVTTQLTEAAADRLLSRNAYTSSYFPDFTGTTGQANILVVGDFSNYVIAQRAGMSIELVQHLVDVTSNRPTGQRGWFAWARTGGNVVVEQGFRLLCNT